MALNDTLNEMFAQAGGVLDVVGDNLYAIAPKVFAVAIVVLLCGAIFGSQMQRGAKIGAVVFVIAVGFALGWLPDIIAGVLSMGGGVDASQASFAADAAGTANAALSELAA